MLVKVTKNTSIESLILAGASIDGKISQQIALAKLGLEIPPTFFFTSDLITRNKIEEYELSPQFYKQIIKKYKDLPYEFQIRTEGINNNELMIDLLSESRIGISADRLAENMLSIMTDGNGIKPVVGIIQVLPPKGLERNAVGGLAQIIKIDEVKHLYITLHFGIATYVSRVGEVDVIVDIPFVDFNEIAQIKNFAQFISAKSKFEVLSSMALDIKRFGINLVTKKYEMLNLERPIDLPYDPTKKRIKREFEFSENELNSTEYLDHICNLSYLIAEFSANKLVNKYLQTMNMHLDTHMTLNTMLVACGLYYLSKTDEFCVTKNQLLALLSDEPVSSILPNSILKLVIKQISKLGDELLTTHMCSFSVGFNAISDKHELIIWDLPLDQEQQFHSDSSIPKNLYWIKAANDPLIALAKDIEDIGIHLAVTNTINQDLLQVLNRLKKDFKVQNVYVKYSLLSHLSTIIREYGFNVIAV